MLFNAKAQNFPIYRDTTVDIEYQINLPEVIISDKNQFANDLERYRYKQMKHYIKIVLPYVDQAVRMFYEIDEVTKNMSAKDRRNYIRQKESLIKTNFEDKIKALNRTQGKYLVKAINRNLGKSCYSIIKELKNPFTAAYYRSASSLYGIDLDENYLADDNPQFELIMKKLGY